MGFNSVFKGLTSIYGYSVVCKRNMSKQQVWYPNLLYLEVPLTSCFQYQSLLPLGIRHTNSWKGTEILTSKTLNTGTPAYKIRIIWPLMNEFVTRVTTKLRNTNCLLLHSPTPDMATSTAKLQDFRDGIFSHQCCPWFRTFGLLRRADW